MALTALSITQSVRPASGMPGCDYEVPTWYGVLNGNSTSYLSGCPLINNAETLDEAAVTTLAGETILGFLATVGPRRQDMAPQTTGVLPAAYLPGQRTTPASGSGRFTDDNDEDFGVQYHPCLPGVLFTAHLTTGTGNGTDLRAGAAANIHVQTGYSRTILAGAANDESNYATKTGLWVLSGPTVSTTNDTETRIVKYVHPQPTSLNGTAFLAQSGRLVRSATGTFNPLVVWTPVKGAWFYGA